MPKRTDIGKIMVIGSGPIVIGQAAEFDYSGAQACRVLLEEGYQVVLVNSNPATIMTDPEFASATYIEPLVPEAVTRVIEQERPDALLPTLGGGTALDLARVLHEDGTLARLGVELIGADYGAIRRAEDRELFKITMEEAGLRVARARNVDSMEEARTALEQIGLPAILRPAYTMGGTGGGIATTSAEYFAAAEAALSASPVGQVQVEESLVGWGEFELEVMRDHRDNAVIVCSIENIDSMGVHTGDSVTVAPQQTLSDSQYQALRDQALTVVRAVGVETGGSNVQFAVEPETGEIVIVEMNPRVSRSSALASKATGFPIAKIAARLAVGYTLDEITNDITGTTPASFEPALDYVVVKWPRFAFEKFPGSDGQLGTSMRSVGEAMAIGRTFKQAFAKARRSRELDVTPTFGTSSDEELLHRLSIPSDDRYEVFYEAARRGISNGVLAARTNINPWYVAQIAELARGEDPQAGLERTFKAVDTCAAEFEAATPYFYSAWERTARSEIDRGHQPSVVILGSGPNRIGQGIEFDYCCVHAAKTVRDAGMDAVMVNCNPETVSTDYDTSTRLYFEPLTFEDVMPIIEFEHPVGVIVQFGGQTPLRLARELKDAGVKILGTPVDAIHRAEDRASFSAVLDEVGLEGPRYATASSAEEALVVAEAVGYPLLVRPSYVLGGRAMEICYDAESLESYLARTVDSRGSREIYLDHFLEDAIEIDVDALCDGERVEIGAIMQHVEEAGVHSGDSACVIPAMSLGHEMIEAISAATRDLALNLGVIGLINIQFAIVGVDRLVVIEANPRASRTVPFVSKAIGVPLARAACSLALGRTLSELDLHIPRRLSHVSVKEAVLPFGRFPGADALLGPEMRSTGEVMGIAADYPSAFGKAQEAAGYKLPSSGTVFVSVTDRDKAVATQMAASFHDGGFKVTATRGTARAIQRMGVPVEVVNKVSEGSPHVVDLIRAGQIDLVINTPTGKGARADGYEIRSAATGGGVPCITTMTGASAAQRAIMAERDPRSDKSFQPATLVKPLQELHGSGTIFISVDNKDKDRAARLADRLFRPHDSLDADAVHRSDAPPTFLASEGTAARLRRAEIPSRIIAHIGDGDDSVVSRIFADEVDYVVYTADEIRHRADGFEILMAARARGIPVATSLDEVLSSSITRALRGDDEAVVVSSAPSLRSAGARGDRTQRRLGVYISVADDEKAEAARLGLALSRQGSHIYATQGTARAMREIEMIGRDDSGAPRYFGVRDDSLTELGKLNGEQRGEILDLIRRGDIDLVIFSAGAERAQREQADAYLILEAAMNRVPWQDTARGLKADQALNLMREHMEASNGMRQGRSGTDNDLSESSRSDPADGNGTAIDQGRTVSLDDTCS